MADFLFELGVEEIPVSEILNISDQLKDKFSSKISQHLVEFKLIDAAATNRRFMVYIKNLGERASDRDEQIKGPSKKIAFDDNNQPTTALKKFLEYNHAGLSDITEIETKKGMYVGINKTEKGEETVQILKRLIPEILRELTFSKTMIWNESRTPFVRPIKNIIALFDSQLIEFEFAGVKSSNKTTGHTLLSTGLVEVNSFREYCELLSLNFVIVNEDERRKKIVDEVVDVEDEYNATVKLDDEMLDYYIYNNEYPVVFFGEFAKKYLKLPPEVISTFMIKEKKLLPVYDKKNKLLNIFVGVSNIPDESRYVASGNERVVHATFEDAKFFWEKDKKDNFIQLRETLKNVVFQRDIGNFYNKTERLVSLVDFLLKETENEKLSDSIKKAARHCKNDLVTRMVREFPSLQGIMGGLYLREKKESQDVWKSVYHHYDPKGYTNERLEHLGAGILAVSDKIDTIAGLVSNGVKISSSKDPYGIRRDVNAIIKIIIDFKLNFDFISLIELSAGKFVRKKNDRQELIKTLQQLFFSRIEGVLKEFFKYRYDVVNSVLNSGSLHIYRIYLRARKVSKMVKSDSIEHLVSLHKRLINITKKFDKFEISEELLSEMEEKILFEVMSESRTKIENLISNDNYLQACSTILEMKPVVDHFFDKVLVMAEDEKIKKNRIALLQDFNELLLQIADFSLIVEQVD